MAVNTEESQMLKLWDRQHDTDKRLTVMETKIETIENSSNALLDRQEKHEAKVDKAFDRLCESLESAVKKFDIFENSVKIAWRTIAIGGSIVGALTAALWAVGEKVLQF